MSQSTVIELRQYTLKPGMRDLLIALFDLQFVESQEECGNEVIGQFRDLGDPDRFVWLRGFADMPSRAEALAAFYGGPVWKAYREAANATMIDTDNVLLLRPARATSGFKRQRERPPREATEIPDGVVTATICSLTSPADDGFLAAFEREMVPQLKIADAPVLASFVTEPSPNNFPALPVREGENVFVWFSTESEASVVWPEAMTSRLSGPARILRLSPTARSKLRV